MNVEIEVIKKMLELGDDWAPKIAGDRIAPGRVIDWFNVTAGVRAAAGLPKKTWWDV